MSPDPEAPEPQTTPQHLTDVDVLRRLRVIEERFLNLRRKAQLADEKLLQSEDKLNTELKAFTQDLAAMRRQLADISESVQAISTEISHAAKQHELKALEKYVAYWEPMEFVTKEEMLRNRKYIKPQPESQDHG